MTYSRNRRRRRIQSERWSSARVEHNPGYAAFWAGVVARREALIEAALARMAEIKMEKKAKREAQA